MKTKTMIVLAVQNVKIRTCLLVLALQKVEDQDDGDADGNYTPPADFGGDSLFQADFSDPADLIQIEPNEPLSGEDVPVWWPNQRTPEISRIEEWTLDTMPDSRDGRFLHSTMKSQSKRNNQVELDCFQLSGELPDSDDELSREHYRPGLSSSSGNRDFAEFGEQHPLGFDRTRSEHGTPGMLANLNPAELAIFETEYPELDPQMFRTGPVFLDEPTHVSQGSQRSWRNVDGSSLRCPTPSDRSDNLTGISTGVSQSSGYQNQRVQESQRIQEQLSRRVQERSQRMQEQQSLRIQEQHSQRMQEQLPPRIQDQHIQSGMSREITPRAERVERQDVPTNFPELGEQHPFGFSRSRSGRGSPGGNLNPADLAIIETEYPELDPQMYRRVPGLLDRSAHVPRGDSMRQHPGPSGSMPRGGSCHCSRNIEASPRGPARGANIPCSHAHNIRGSDLQRGTHKILTRLTCVPDEPIKCDSGIQHIIHIYCQCGETRVRSGGADEMGSLQGMSSSRRRARDPNRCVSFRN
ncbi:uncharacterized protein LOC105696004 [Orussus abietinus]|uniref:uncharacterized protein LOC105696004 n=1 Tax=Orussus abietinus TaxID=222816 RepID=UPI000625D6A2|nr:uncharacterized protein LOC105696004 [Orussus abietinus]